MFYLEAQRYGMEYSRHFTSHITATAARSTGIIPSKFGTGEPRLVRRCTVFARAPPLPRRNRITVDPQPPPFLPSFLLRCFVQCLITQALLVGILPIPPSPAGAHHFEVDVPIFENDLADDPLVPVLFVPINLDLFAGYEPGQMILNRVVEPVSRWFSTACRMLPTTRRC